MTASWGPDELREIGTARELQIASRRPDGTLRAWVPVWVVCTGGLVYVRTSEESAHLPAATTLRVCRNSRPVNSYQLSERVAPRVCRLGRDFRPELCWLAARREFSGQLTALIAAGRPLCYA
jgi:hypothetical protein